MSSQPNQGLIDGLTCLSTLAAASEAIGGRELARRTGLHHVKVNRLLMTLASLGVVRQDERRRYLPGPGLHVLATLAMQHSGLLRRAQPALAELRPAWPEAVLALGVRWQDQVAYLIHGRNDQPLEESLGRTSLHPAEHSSIGRVLGAWQADATDRAASRIRRDGYVCLTHEHGGWSHRSIAVPIIEYDQPIAGLALTDIAPDNDQKQAVAELRAAADRIVHA